MFAGSAKFHGFSIGCRRSIGYPATVRLGRPAEVEA